MTQQNLISTTKQNPFFAVAIALIFSSHEMVTGNPLSEEEREAKANELLQSKADHLWRFFGVPAEDHVNNRDTYLCESMVQLIAGEANNSFMNAAKIYEKHQEKIWKEELRIETMGKTAAEAASTFTKSEEGAAFGYEKKIAVRDEHIVVMKNAADERRYFVVKFEARNSSASATEVVDEKTINEMYNFNIEAEMKKVFFKPEE